MSESKLEGVDYDRWLSQSERAAHDAVMASNNAFMLAMAKAVKCGREKVTAGTYIDDSPPIGALRIRGDIVMSPCGSPAAMCMK